jgi:uncharacterized protein
VTRLYKILMLPTMNTQHTDDGHKGIFFIADDNSTKGKHLAEMTYVYAGETKIIVDHTDVDESLKGQGVGRMLLSSLVEYVREKGLKVIPLCPYAKSQFDKDESIRDVLV